jgi:hypothetical protein
MPSLRSISISYATSWRREGGRAGGREGERGRERECYLRIHILYCTCPRQRGRDIGRERRESEGAREKARETVKMPASSSIGSESSILPRTKHEGLSAAVSALLTYKKIRGKKQENKKYERMRHLGRAARCSLTTKKKLLKKIK